MNPEKIYVTYADLNAVVIRIAQEFRLAENQNLELLTRQTLALERIANRLDKLKLYELPVRSK